MIDDLMISSERNGNVSSSTNKGKTAMGKVKEKEKEKEKEKAVEEEAGGVMEFIIPTLPSQGVKSKPATQPVLIQKQTDVSISNPK